MTVLNTEQKLKQSAKPPTIKPNAFKEWLRVKLLYHYLKEIPKNEKTLDIGCGWGISFKINPDFYGIEFDQDCYNSLKDHKKVKLGNILNELPFEKDYFDNCFTQDVLEHFSLSDIEKIFTHVHRILKPNGKFINVVPNQKGYNYGLDIGAGHVHHVTTADIYQIAEKTGFQVERFSAYPLPENLSELYTHNKWVYHLRKKPDATSTETATKKIIVYAINIHAGGGKILLDELLTKKVFGEISALFHDERYTPPPGNYPKFSIEPHILSRLKAEEQLQEFSKNHLDDSILFFGNLPPMRRFKNKSILYLQNALLLGCCELPKNKLKTFARLALEQLHLKTFIKNCDEVWVQSEWMKKHTAESFKMNPEAIQIRRFLPTLPPADPHIEKKYDYIIIAGSEPHKRLNVFLSALLNVAEKMNFSLCLAATGLDESSKALIEKINARKHIIHLYANPNRQDLLNLIQASKKMIITSKSESFCLPFYEAKHFNIPRIVIDSDFFDKNEEFEYYDSFEEFFETIEGQNDFLRY